MCAAHWDFRPDNSQSGYLRIASLCASNFRCTSSFGIRRLGASDRLAALVGPTLNGSLNRDNRLSSGQQENKRVEHLAGLVRDRVFCQ